MKRIFIFCLLIIISSIPVFSSTVQENLIKGSISVRQMGMGGAATGVADDMSASFYNPAGLAKSEIGGMSFGTVDTNKDLFDSNHYYSYNLGGLYYTGFQKNLPTGDRMTADMFSFAQKSRMGLAYGLTYKNLNYESPTLLQRGYSMDLGLLLSLTPSVNIGILGQDAFSDNQLGLHSSTRVGLAWKPFRDILLIAVDSEMGRIGPGDYSHYGAELMISQGFKVRAGQDSGKTTFGVSVNFPAMAVHYAALLDNAVPNGTVHMVGAEFTMTPNEERPLSIIRPKQFAIIDIGGSLTGGIGEFSIFGGGRVGADSVIANIKEAANDPYIDGIMIKVRGFDSGLGTYGMVQEIRTELLKAKLKGKKIVAYMEEGCLGDEYYLATAADKVVAPSAATVGGLGKSFGVIRIKELLSKIGVEVQMITKGKYKNSFSMFNDNYTKDQKEMMQSVVSDLYRQMINDIEESRHDSISMEALKRAADGSIYSANKAKTLGLIDNVGYYSDALKVAANLYNSSEEVQLVERKDLLKGFDQDFFFSFPNKIAVINIDGDIVTGKSGSNILFGGHTTGADTMTEQIRKAADDWQVKAILVRVNSGGGSAVASGQIHSELLKAKAKGKIIVASMGDVAASGGYYISAAADKIVADPGTITGSIGVIGGEHLVFEGLFKKLGIKTETIKEGKHSDMFSSSRRMSTEEVRMITSYMQDTYEEFVRVVAESRKMTTQEVEKVAQGRIYTGNQAKELKLVDELGNFSDSVDLAADMSKIMGEPKLIYYGTDDFFLNFGMGAMKMMGLSGGIFLQNNSGLAEYKLSY